MPLQTTKPTIPFKDNSSPEPSAKNFYATEANAIVDAFEKVDENFEEVMLEIGEIPKTGNQIISAIETVTEEEDKIQVGDIAFFGSEVRSIIDLEVPEIDPINDQFGVTASPDNQLLFKNPFITTAGSVITFDLWRTYGTPTAPLTGNLTANFTGALRGSRQVVYHAAGTVPTIPASFMITDGAYSIVSGDLNIMVIDFHDTGLQTVRITTVEYSAEPPILENIIFHLEFEDDVTGGPVIIADSGPFDATVNILATSGVLVSEAGPVGNAIGFGNTSGSDGTRGEIINFTELGAISTAFTIAFWMKHPTGQALIGSTILDSSDSYADNGIRITHLSDGRINIYLNNIGAENSANRLRIATDPVTADSVYYHWIFTYDGTDVTVYKNNVQVGTSGALAGRNVSNTNNWYLNGNIGGSMTRKWFDDLFIVNRAITSGERATLYARG
jgi:hypothetical protein